MRKLAHAIGVLMIFQGAGGAIDQLGVHLQLFGALYVLKRLPFLDNYVIFANVVLAVLGFVVLAAAGRPAAERAA
jgi:hypothetical protein